MYGCNTAATITTIAALGVLMCICLSYQLIQTNKIFVENESYQIQSEFISNNESLNLLAHLWHYRLSHDETKQHSKEYNKHYNSMGNLLHRQKQLKVWNTLSHQQYIQQNATICEIGFAFGFSALVILESDPFVKYVGFDIGRDYSRHAYEVMKHFYGSRAKMFWGDSSTTILKVARSEEYMKNPFVCDIWIIDGVHSVTGTTKDIDAIIDTGLFMTQKYPHNVILWDDCQITAINNGDDTTHYNVTGTGGMYGASKALHMKLMESQEKTVLLWVSGGAETDVRNKAVRWCVTKLWNT